MYTTLSKHEFIRQKFSLYNREKVLRHIFEERMKSREIVRTEA